MKKLIVTETFSHADGLYRISYFTEDDPELKRRRGQSPAIVTTLELERYGAWHVVQHRAFIPSRGQSVLDPFDIPASLPPELVRAPITLTNEELQKRSAIVCSTLVAQLNAELRKEPASLPRWQVVTAVLLFHLAFSSVFLHVRAPWAVVAAFQLPILLFSYCFYAFGRWVDRTFYS
jgi:hypothetical protein